MKRELSRERADESQLHLDVARRRLSLVGAVTRNAVTKQRQATRASCEVSPIGEIERP